ncbi:unnamed protein product, partial [Iphiclides podalirius]
MWHPIKCFDNEAITSHYRNDQVVNHSTERATRNWILRFVCNNDIYTEGNSKMLIKYLTALILISTTSVVAIKEKLDCAEGVTTKTDDARVEINFARKEFPTAHGNEDKDNKEDGCEHSNGDLGLQEYGVKGSPAAIKEPAVERIQLRMIFGADRTPKSAFQGEQLETNQTTIMTIVWSPYEKKRCELQQSSTANP